MKYKFSHIGIPCREKMQNEKLEEHLQVYITPLEKDDMHFEYIRFIPETILPRILNGQIHIGYEVLDIESAVSEDEEIIMSITDINTKKIAFIMRKGVIIELIQNLESE